MGNLGVRNDECSHGRCAAMDHKYAVAVCGMGVFEEKRKIICTFDKKVVSLYRNSGGTTRGT